MTLGGWLCSLVAASVACLAPAWVVAADDAPKGPEWTGSVRLNGESASASPHGPLAQARSLSSVVGAHVSGKEDVQTTMRVLWGGVSGSATAFGAWGDDTARRYRAVLNDLVATTDAGGINLLVGKSVVSWDVGYAFRPNDMVQQEARRGLLASPLEGRPMLMAQGFREGQAWSALVFKQARRAQDNTPAGKEERAVAARYFIQLGSADLYAFGKYGEHSHASVGAAASWVASEQLEVHGSYRRTGLQTLPALAVGVPAIASSNPYALGPEAHRNQALVGLTWTTSEKISLLAEAWYDGGAPPDAFWSAWRSRGDGIWAIAQGPGAALVPANAAAGNLGWQASQLSGYGLRRENIFVRMSWTRDEWQPALDVLFTPRDGGLVATAAVSWQGDRVRLDAGVRYYGGRNGSLYWQTPRRSIVYAGVAVPF